MTMRKVLPAAFVVFLVLAVITVTRHSTAAPGGKYASAVMSQQTNKSKPQPTTFAVTSTVNDFDSLNNPLQLQSDDLNVDLTGTAGPYGIYHADSATDVATLINGTNDSSWSINLSRSTSRSVNLTFNRLSGSGPTGGPNPLHAVVISKCFDPNGGATGDQNWFNITTADPNCSLRMDFSIGSTTYRLVMSPLDDSPQPTGRAIVTCTLSSGNSCFAWSVLPNLTQDNVINPNPGVANLYSVSRKGDTFIGQYGLTYSMNVTYP